MENISLENIKERNEGKIVIDLSSEFWQDEDNIEDFCKTLIENTSPLILELNRPGDEGYYKLTGRILWHLKNYKGIHTLIFSNIPIKLSMLTSISESEMYPKYKNKYSLNFLELLLTDLFYEHKNLKRFQISRCGGFSLFILLLILSEVNERTNKIIERIPLLDIKAVANGLNNTAPYSKRKNCNLIEFSVLSLVGPPALNDNTLLITNDLIFEIIDTNRKLKSLHLPEIDMNNEKLLKSLELNYTLLDCNFQPDNIRQRNNKIYQWTKDGALTIIMIKKYRKSILNNLNKDLILLITKRLWNFRHDLDHLRRLANQL